MTEQSLAQFADEIMPGLWLGDVNAGDIALRLPGFNVLCVLEQRSAALSCHIPILVDPLTNEGPRERAIAYQRRLDDAATWIRQMWFETGQPTLVHCGAGIERAPLTIAWFLVKHHHATLDGAYAWLMKRRPCVADRRAWLEVMP